MRAGSQPQRPTPADSGPFRCEVVRAHDSAHIRALGELDLATVAILRAELDTLREAGFRV